MPDELTVVWNGAHLGKDADLFCFIPRPQPETHDGRLFRSDDVKHHRDSDQIVAEREAVLAVLRAAPCTRRNVRTVTGLSEAAVNVAFTQLARDGAIVNDGYGIWRAI